MSDDVSAWHSRSAQSLTELVWSPWVALEGAKRDPAVSQLAGLYRIRSVETRRVLYIGQTGRSLRKRLSELTGVYGDEMPFNDPHTAGPALWAHRVEFGETFEVSVAVLEVNKADRMGREALEVTKRRIIDGTSPAYNFGRMPHGWVKSRGNNRKHLAPGQRTRGRRMTAEEIAALTSDTSAAPPTTLEGNARAADWLGLAWQSAELAAPRRDAIGVYRIATRASGPLDYLGQGLIINRWRSHARKWVADLAAEQTDTTTWGWVPLEHNERQLLEIENDLIASHMVLFARPPVAQFGDLDQLSRAGVHSPQSR